MLARRLLWPRANTRSSKVDAMPLHPAVIHLPLGLAVILPLIVGAMAYALWREEIPRKAWALALALQGILVATVWAGMRAGAADLQKVQILVPAAQLQAHEAAAQALFAGSLVALLVYAAVFAFNSVVARRTATIAAAVASVAVACLALWVGRAGGSLVYTYGAAEAHAPAVPGSSPSPVAQH